MPTAYPLPENVSPATVANTASLLRIIALGLISAAAIASRLFAVINFESIIHEFDPWFNYRATRVLASKGFYEFWNWFDPTAWYPLGRVVGGTIYPGLMTTSGVIYYILHALHLPVDIRNICVLLAPGFSALTAWATYMFTKEMKDDSAGLLAAAFIGIVPGYISRSVAGSYDNEAIAIFLLMFTFFSWIKALKQGSAFFGTIAALFYFYMVAAWGGYVFITNMIPLHALVLLLMGRFTSRLYVAYSSWYAIGTLASMQVPFVGFQPVRTSEHMAALGVFGLLQIVAFAQLVRAHFQNLLFVAVGVLGFFAIVGLTYKGWIAPWTGRFYSLWDTGYAKKFHQPTAWPSFFMDLHFLIWLFPAGVVMCFRALRDEHIFVIIYAAMASYFAGVMVRLMLALTPVVCPTVNEKAEPVNDPPSTNVPVTPKKAKKLKDKETAATARGALGDLVSSVTSATGGSTNSPKTTKGIFGLDGRVAVLVNALGLLLFFHLIDDFREAYYWLRQNTAEDAVVMSWWDYGYQIAGMANRTTLVDNNTWNNTHIATVGKAMSSPEEVAYPILRKHDVNYVLVIFGGLIGYSGDDMNKFLWMVRISQGVWPDEIQEPNYFNNGEYRVDDRASPTMKESIDRVRGQHMPANGPTLDYLEEAFTSENWIVRIYEVKKDDVLGRDLKVANAFGEGKKRKRTKPIARRKALVTEIATSET
ncbi:glycosyltransferase family 66 protein [Pisolithus microcarpus]|nr:glycosyltransferase family 66 protein [Pisolithus microcarpus]